MIPLFSFLFGLIVGSFLNVCIHRLPRHESVVFPHSHCPQCGHAIAPYDNVPLLSYLWLRGKCRHCRARISPLYFFVELATGLAFLFLFWVFGLTLLLVKQMVLAAILIVLVVTDWQERLLPDAVTFPGMALGLVFSQVVAVGDGTGFWLLRLAGLEGVSGRVDSLLDSLLGAAVGGGILYVLGEVYFRLRHREGMGFGDVKMMAMVGFFLGPKLAALTIFLGSMSGAILGGLFILVFRRTSGYELPFGTFLGVMALVAAVWGPEIVYWYQSLYF